MIQFINSVNSRILLLKSVDKEFAASEKKILHSVKLFSEPHASYHKVKLNAHNNIRN